jgi:hypothetical protein
MGNVEQGSLLQPISARRVADDKGRGDMMNRSIQEALIVTLRGMGIYVTPEVLLRTFALAEGHLIAEKFHYDGGCAVWDVGRGSLDFYDEGGNRLTSVVVEAADEPGKGTAA